MEREWSSLTTLAGSGAPVPRPIQRTGDAILMTYIGDESTAAPQLRSCRPGRVEAADLFEQVMSAVKLMLFHNVVHGDLSAYNILVWEGLITLIDLPQAVDPRKNRHAQAFLERDIDRVCEHFAKFGVSADAKRLADDLWTGWTYADLVPEELRGLM